MNIKKNLSVDNNVVLVQILGVCSILAVTSEMKTSLMMAGSVICVSSISSFIVSCIRKYIPSETRLLLQMLVISSLVVIVDMSIKAFFYDISKSLSIFVSLIITNCIILGRTEGFAMRNTPLLSFIDGLTTSIGYSAVILSVGFFRELLARGTLFGVEILKLKTSEGWFEGSSLMATPASVFFIIAVFIWILPIKQTKK